MKLIYAVVKVLCVAICVSSCNGSDGQPDAGNDSDEWQPEDNDLDAGADRSDAGPIEGLRVTFSSGATACGVPYTNGRSWQDEHKLLGQVWFEEITELMPEELGQTEADLIQRVVVGPGRIQAVPLGPGQMLHSLQGDQHRFEYTQEFDLAGGPYRLQMAFNFSPDREEIRIDDDFLGGPQTPVVEYPYHDPDIHCDMGPRIVEMRGFVGAGEGLSETQFFNSCGYRTLDIYDITIEVEGGDGMNLHQRWHWSFCGSGPANLVWAEVDIQGATNKVDDYFYLIHRAEHHNWAEAFLVVLDPPVGEVHGLLLEETFENTPPADMLYLDANLEELYRRAVLTYEGGPPNVK